MVNRELTRSKVKELSRKDLHWMKKQIARELTARYLEDKAFSERMMAGWQGMANFMAGVTYCVPVTASTDYQAFARAYIAASQSTASAGMSLWFYSQARCGCRGNCSRRCGTR